MKIAYGRLGARCRGPDGRHPGSGPQGRRRTGLCPWGRLAAVAGLGQAGGGPSGGGQEGAVRRPVGEVGVGVAGPGQAEGRRGAGGTIGSLQGRPVRWARCPHPSQGRGVGFGAGCEVRTAVGGGRGPSCGRSPVPLGAREAVGLRVPPEVGCRPAAVEADVLRQQELWGLGGNQRETLRDPERRRSSW